MKTTVVNIRTSNYDVYIGRQGRGHDGYWGNPFTIGKDGDRQRVLSLYFAYFRNRMIDDPEFLSRLQKLIGQRLGCFCAPLPCHGNAMAEYLNIEPKVKPYVDKLISAGFSTWASCDGGEGHPKNGVPKGCGWNKRFIRMHPTRPTVDCLCGFPVEHDGNQHVLDRFIELCRLIEQNKWTHCTPRLIWAYDTIKIDGQLKSLPRPHFELVWN